MAAAEAFHLVVVGEAEAFHPVAVVEVSGAWAVVAEEPCLEVEVVAEGEAGADSRRVTCTTLLHCLLYVPK